MVKLRTKLYSPEAYALLSRALEAWHGMDARPRDWYLYKPEEWLTVEAGFARLATLVRERDGELVVYALNVCSAKNTDPRLFMNEYAPGSSARENAEKFYAGIQHVADEFESRLAKYLRNVLSGAERWPFGERLTRSDVSEFAAHFEGGSRLPAKLAGSQLDPIETELRAEARAAMAAAREEKREALAALDAKKAAWFAKVVADRTFRGRAPSAGELAAEREAFARVRSECEAERAEIKRKYRETAEKIKKGLR